MKNPAEAIGEVLDRHTSKRDAPESTAAIARDQGRARARAALAEFLPYRGGSA